MVGWLLDAASESFQIDAIDNDDEEVFYDKSKVIDVDVDGDELSQACPFPDSLLF